MFKLKLSSSIKLFSPPFGLDISDLSIKLVSLNKKGSLNFASKNKSLTLTAYNQIEVPSGYFYEGKIIETEKIIKLIKKLIKEASNSQKLSNYVISVLPETKAFIKLIEIPNVPQEKISEQVDKEIQNHFPFALNEVYLDWQRLTESGETSEKIKVLVSIATRDIVNQYTNLLIAAGLKPFALEIESSAICRCLLPEEAKPSLENKSKSATAIIDIGATRTSLIVYDADIIQFTTSVPFAGQRITEKIAKTLEINLKQAEKAKIKCGLDESKCQGILKKILYEDIQEMIAKIKNSLLFYQNHFPENNPIKKILTCGGGAGFKGINPILENELGIDVKTADPLINIENKKVKIQKEQALIYTTAIGLALRGLLIND